MPGIFKPVTSSDAFEGMTQNLNEEGLYSVDIFGRVGSAERDEIEAVINTKLPIFNPTYFKTLIQLKSLYLGVIKGSEYAVWDSQEKDFIKSNMLEGETGFSFFMSHYGEIVPKHTDSYKRKQRIELFEGQKDKAMTDKVLVIPAGLRDIQFNPNGSAMEPELNELYRKLLFRSRSVLNIPKGDENNPLYDNVRWGLQSGFVDIDDYLFNMSKGKGGFFQSRISTRGVVGGTRNVITARKVSRNNLFKGNGVGVNSTDIGMYQALMMFQYHSIYALTSGYLERVFTTGSVTAKLVNTKTLEYEYVETDAETVDKWTTPEGLIKMFNGFMDTHLRHRPIKIKGYYLGLVYDDGKNVRIFGDINELPEGFNKKYVTPLNYIELFYLSCQQIIQSKMMQQTRYPITGIGSVYPSHVNLLTTQNATGRNILDDYWEVSETCLAFPHKEDNPDYFDAMSVDPTREAGLGSDHDGDQLNGIGIMGEDSIEEVKQLFGRRSFYISGSGDFLYDPVNEPVMFLMKAATSGLNK